jgi:hypothetical protein
LQMFSTECSRQYATPTLTVPTNCTRNMDFVGIFTPTSAGIRRKDTACDMPINVERAGDELKEERPINVAGRACSIELTLGRSQIEWHGLGR